LQATRNDTLFDAKPNYFYIPQLFIKSAIIYKNRLEVDSNTVQKSSRLTGLIN